MTFQYANVSKKFKQFMKQLQHVGVPDKATTRWLESVGYKSNNDRNNLKVLNFIGFIDGSGKPTEKWLQYRGADYKSVLGSAVKEGYAELYKTFPNAHELDDTTLDSYFSTKTTAGKQVVGRMTRTFKDLVEMAEFDDNVGATQTIAPSGDVKTSAAQTTQPNTKSKDSSSNLPTSVQVSKLAPSLHIDVQIHISSDMTADQIDQIFASMAKHLYAN